ncbi:DUF2523 family protein [Pseudoxanthomonas koreensis]|uniref:DUF2523 family protein n=1 Tax=Pseudoxanthomonas koreensis TaxID=266061 RepID=UPI0035A64D42
MPFLAPILSALLTGLAWLFRNRIGQWVTAALVWMGLAWATNEFAVQPWIDSLETSMTPGAIGGGDLAAVAIAWIGVLRFDVACTMIASAVAAKFAVGAAKAFLVRRT